MGLVEAVYDAIYLRVGGPIEIFSAATLHLIGTSSAAYELMPGGLGPPVVDLLQERAYAWGMNPFYNTQGTFGPPAKGILKYDALLNTVVPWGPVSGSEFEVKGSIVKSDASYGYVVYTPDGSHADLAEVRLSDGVVTRTWTSPGTAGAFNGMGFNVGETKVVFAAVGPNTPHPIPLVRVVDLTTGAITINTNTGLEDLYPPYTVPLTGVNAERVVLYFIGNGVVAGVKDTVTDHTLWENDYSFLSGSGSAWMSPDESKVYVPLLNSSSSPLSGVPPHSSLTYILNAATGALIGSSPLMYQSFVTGLKSGYFLAIVYDPHGGAGAVLQTFDTNLNVVGSSPYPVAQYYVTTDQSAVWVSEQTNIQYQLRKLSLPALDTLAVIPLGAFPFEAQPFVMLYRTAGAPPTRQTPRDDGLALGSSAPAGWSRATLERAELLPGRHKRHLSLMSSGYSRAMEAF